MHSPETVAFEIKSPFKTEKSFLFPEGYRKPIITIWHKDTEKDGTDDSCGWFMWARHGDKNVLAEIEKEFEFNFKHNYWFDKNGKQIFSTIGTLIEMYRHATYIYFKGNRRRQKKFIQKHLFDIIWLAENPVDCMGDTITNKFGFKGEEENMERRGLASMIYADILRKDRKWYRHPKWHIWHWRLQFHPFQDLKRRFWDKCSGCGKRGFKTSAIGEWSGKKMWHPECYNPIAPSTPNPSVHINPNDN